VPTGVKFDLIYDLNNDSRDSTPDRKPDNTSRRAAIEIIESSGYNLSEESGYNVTLSLNFGSDKSDNETETVVKTPTNRTDLKVTTKRKLMGKASDLSPSPNAGEPGIHYDADIETYGEKMPNLARPILFLKHYFDLCRY